MMSCEIILSNGMIALIDDEDKEKIIPYRWHANKNSIDKTWYAVGYCNGKHVRMHIIIMEKLNPNSMDIDHKDRNGLNNIKSNLRLATKSQSIINQGIKNTNMSGYKGVSWDKKAQKYRAGITFKGMTSNLGNFDNPEDAARAFNRAAYNLHKEWAVLNEVEPKF
jgi:hypothetical protein